MVFLVGCSEDDLRHPSTYFMKSLTKESEIPT
jgi:hypothetical protein